MSCINTDTRAGHEVIVTAAEKHSVEDQKWNPHPKFKGVFLKHLVTGSGTGDRMSLHHVRIYPGCEIGDHAHAGQVEIHDVLAGEGTCTLGGMEIPYRPGVLGVMPADTVHRVTAGDHGLLLLATFSPPLV